jgi:hypothetical protein
MNVQQLIEELQKHPPEMRVIIRGYEEGYDDLDLLIQKSIRLSINSPDEWRDGKYGDADGGWSESYPICDNDGTIETALLFANH